MFRVSGKNIILGVTGGIAAYKACELTRRLINEEANVQIIMTNNATEFISPLTFQTLSRKGLKRKGGNKLRSIISHNYLYIGFFIYEPSCKLAGFISGNATSNT